MHKLIIFEGLDNTGKTTLIDRFIRILKQLQYTYKVIKADNPLKGYNIEELTLEQIQVITDNYYKDFINNIAEVSMRFNYIILDRSWISEYVYGEIYRKQDPLHIIENNIIYERKLLKLYGEDYIHLYILIASAKFVIAHDDGLSLSEKDTLKINNEISLFNKVMDLTLIQQKQWMDVQDLPAQTYKDWLPYIVSELVPIN